jgi:cytochrome P450
MNTMAGAPNIPAHVPPDRVVDFDFLSDPRLTEDPYGAYHELHQSPHNMLWTTANGGHWIVTRYDQIRNMWQQYEKFASIYTTIPPAKHTRTSSQLPMSVDPPVHTPYRKLLNPIFGPAAIGDLEAHSRQVVRDLLDKMVPKGRAEIMADLTIPLPGTIFLSFMGLPKERNLEFVDWKDDFFRSPDLESKEAAISKIEHEMNLLFDERIKNPQNDIATKLATAVMEDGTPLSREEALGMGFLLFIAGLDTVTNTLAFVFKHLATHPEQRQRLLDDPSLIRDAIEEMMRRYSVVNPIRTATGDFEWEGVQIKEGDQFMAGCVLANLDDRQFKNPMEVIFEREPNAHLNFAAGPHRCAGSHLARIEMRVALEEALPRLKNLRLQPGAKIEHFFGVMCGLKGVPLEWDVD